MSAMAGFLAALRTAARKRFRPRKCDKQRVCPDCSGLVFPGERRCRCGGKNFGPPPRPAPEGSVEAAHNYQLLKSMRSGSWSQTGYRAAQSAYRDCLKSLYDGTGDNRGFDFEYRSTPKYSMREVSWFICRCEIAMIYWRSSFDGLMGSRLELWAAGCTQQKTCDILGIKRTALLWLDKHIRENFIWFPGRPWVAEPEYLTIRRKWKVGVADRILRQRKHNYKQSQALPPQPVKKHPSKMDEIYEEEVQDAVQDVQDDPEAGHYDQGDYVHDQA